MSQLVPDGQGFRLVSTYHDYQPPNYLERTCQHERAMEVITTIAKGDIEKLMQIHYDVLADPQFDNRTNVRDWRNYVPSEIQELWPELSPRERAIVALFAIDQASGENWE